MKKWNGKMTTKTKTNGTGTFKKAKLIGKKSKRIA